MQEGNGNNAFILIFSDNHIGCPKIYFQTAVWLYVFIAFKPQTDFFHTKKYLVQRNPLPLGEEGAFSYIYVFFQVHPYLSKIQTNFTSFYFSHEHSIYFVIRRKVGKIYLSQISEPSNLREPISTNYCFWGIFERSKSDMIMKCDSVTFSVQSEILVQKGVLSSH